MGNPLLNESSDLEFYSFDPVRQPGKVISNFLFAQPRHLFLQAKTGWQVFGLKVKSTPVVQISFYFKNKKASSPFKAPFGSIQWSEKISQKKLAFFFEILLAHLKERGVKDIAITNFPEAYEPSVSILLNKSLGDLGFIEKKHVSSFIPVDEEEFSSKIKISEKQKLKKGKANFHFTQVSTSQLKKVYGFIAACRLQKNHSLSMSLAQVEKLKKVYPDDIFLFEITDKERTIAAALVIRINKKILYTFYYAHDPQFDKVSPVVFLLSGIYDFANNSGYKMIDLGTSMNGDEVNKPLLHFKDSVGGKRTNKYIFQKKLS